MSQPDSGEQVRLDLNVPFSGVFEHCPDDNAGSSFDQDSFFFDSPRFSLFVPQLYEVVVAIDSDLVQITQFGQVVEHLSFSGPSSGQPAQARFIVQAFSGSQQTFFSIDNLGSGSQEQNYTVTASRFEVPEGPSSVVNLLADGGRKTNVIDSKTDADTWAVVLEEGFIYRFDLKQLSLADPFLRLFDGNYTQLAANDNGGSGNDALITYRASYSGTHFLTASGVDIAGSYQLSSTVVDWPDLVPDHPGTNSRLEIRPDGSTDSVSGLLEYRRDVDWHQVDLIAGRWYRIPNFNQRTNVAHLQIRTPDFQVKRAEIDGFYRAEETGRHFVEVGLFNGAYTGGYAVTVTDDFAPPVGGVPTANLYGSNSSITFNHMFNLLDFPAESVQLFSEADFTINQIKFEKFQVHNIDIADVPAIRFNGADIDPGLYDISFRALGAGTVSKWHETTLDVRQTADEVLDIGRIWDSSNTELQSDRVITYRFADTVPAHFAAGRFSGVEAVSPDVQTAIEGILGLTATNGLPGLESTTGLEFRLSESETADIQIFAADSVDRAVGFAPGVAGFGDIVLDNEFFAGDASAVPGSQNYFDLLKAVGSSLGIKHFALEFDRTESVVGLAYYDSVDKPYPDTFGARDIEYLRLRYGRNFDGAPDFPLWFGLGETDQPFERALHELRFEDLTIHAINSPRPVSIDLRSDGISYLLGDGPWQSYTGDARSAVGSQFNDVIRGHRHGSTIDGLGGDDIIEGLTGIDNIAGGLGNDTYLYTTGDGDDVLFDAGGTDTLQIKGKFGLTSVSRDLSFQRINGDELVISLDMYGLPNRTIASITIEGMNHSVTQIERLDLRNFASELGVYSLPSVWANATEVKQRFAPNGSSDAFGLTLSPV